MVMPADSRNFPASGNFSGFQIVQPSPNPFAERLDPKAAMNTGKAIQFQETGTKQVPRSQKVVAGMVVKRGGNLNEPLQKQFVRIGRLKPHFFPVLVRLIKVAGIKSIKSFLI
jgi:hypothetical protein